MPLPENERLGVVILTYGRDALHESLVNDLIVRDEVARDAIVVVHNPFGPEDRWLPPVPESVRVQRMPDNAGFAGGMNAGAATHAERREYVLFLTHDVRL